MTNLRTSRFRACFISCAVILGACSSSSSNGNTGGQGAGGQAGSSTPAGTGGAGGSVGSGGSIPSGSGGASATGGVSGGGYDAGHADVAVPNDTASGGISGGGTVGIDGSNGSGGSAPQGSGGSPATGGTSGGDGASDAKSSDVPVPTDTGVTGGTLSVSGTYVTAGSLRGYSWARPFGAAPGTTVTPANTSNALCMTGTVGADSTLKTFVSLGFNLNETGAGKGSVAAPSSITVVATVDTGSGGQGASIQLNPSVPAGSFGIAPPNYCVNAGDWTSGAAIPITSFSTGKCKNQTSSVDAGDTALAAGTQIEAITLVVQSAATATSFSVCLSGVSFN
jgi:hypothetical protein